MVMPIGICAHAGEKGSCSAASFAAQNDSRSTAGIP